MPGRARRRTSLAKTTAGRWSLWLFLFAVGLNLAGCGWGHGNEHGPNSEHAAGGHGHGEEAEEALSRTEFTERIENFFEHDPLKAGKPSQFLIHLTDLTDGTPVEKADVTLTARPKGGAAATEVKAKVGKVTGIYVAELALPSAGIYDIEFSVRNEKIDERMALTDFEVTAQ
jgi:hypothetical protein